MDRRWLPARHGGNPEVSKTPGGVQYNSSDLFVATANGSVSNLVPRTDSTWGGAGHYENQTDGAFLNYYFNASAGGAAGIWQVKDKNGTVYYYGSSANSQLANYYGAFEWFLDQGAGRKRKLHVRDLLAGFCK